MKHSLAIRMLSVLLALVMVVGYVPTAAFATEGQQEEPAAEASLVSDVITCIVTLDAKNGSEAVTETVVAGEAMEAPKTPAYEGYEFTGWYNGEELWDFAIPVTADMTLSAGWQEVVPAADTTAAYKVEHYLQTAEGYALEATDELEGIVGESTAAEAKSYEGFDAKAFKQGTVAADGTTVIRIEYDTVVTEPATAAYKVEHYLQTAEGYALEATDELEGIVGESTAAEAKAYEGFAAKAFAQGAVAADGTTVIRIEYDAVKTEPATAAYKVEHCLQTAEGYELKETDELEGIVGESTAAEAKAYEGFEAKAFEQGTVAADGTTVIRIEYDAVVVVAATDSGMPDHMTVVSNKESDLAPGITLDEFVVYDRNKNRVEIYVATADLSEDTVGIYAAYKNDQNDEYGMSKLTEQVAAAEAKNPEPFSVVSGINASYYNMTTGKPLGAFVMKGNDVTGQKADGKWEGDDYSFFAILKDGTPFIGYKGEYSKYRGQIQEAVQGHIHLIKDGKILPGLDAVTKYPRQTIGITADGRVLTMTADGNQAPKSIGLTVQEQAEVMLALGCVEAVHMDGGGSCTYGAKREGEDTFKVISSPCDGSERSVSNSLIFVSTAAPDGAFHHANLFAEHDYVTPGSKVAVSAVGVDFAGGSAEIPAEGITWQVADATLGTVENGVFTSSGEVGDAEIQMMYNGAEVGSTTIHVVVPEKLEFNQSTITLPYGKTIELAITATVNNGVNEVLLKDGDIAFALSDDAIGTINGFKLTACAENSAVTSGTVKATVIGTEVTAEATLSLGKGSEVLYNFEDGQVGNWKLKPWESTPNVATNLEIVNSKTGKVRSGNNAMALEMDFTQEIGTGYQMAALYFPEDVYIKNAQRVGMWVYLPEEFTGLYARYCAYTGAYDPKNAKTNRYAGGTFDPTHGLDAETGCVYVIEESGWYYFSLDVSKYSDIHLWKDARCIEFYSSDRDGTVFGYTYVTTDNKQINTSAYGKYTLYIDDVTVDYSAAADDREAPVFGQVSVINEGEGSTVLNRLTQACAPHVIPVFSTNTLTMNAVVAEDTTWANATGLNEGSAKCYVDGYEVDCKFVNGNFVLENHYFTNGIHTVRFVIADNAGNERSAVRKVNIQGTAGNPTLSLVPADPDADKILAGSLYYVNLETSALADVESVSVTLDLNSVSKWELEGMEVANGFTASYAFVGSEDGVVINFTRNGDKLEDTEVLASIPVRAWYHKASVDPVAKWKAQDICPVDVRIEIDSGKMVMKNGDVITFTSDRIRVDTEIYGTYAVLNANGDYKNKSSWHIHAAKPMEDKKATCTETGYTGRTFCEVCNSVVAWGTTLSSGGHTYELTEGVLKCTCGKLFNGVFTDGKTYIEGIVHADGWENDTYYRDGVLLTGVQKVPAADNSGEFFYDFGEDGKSEGLYTGLAEVDGNLYYTIQGAAQTGWIFEEGNYYYFDKTTGAAVDGKVKVEGYTYEFENWILVDGAWVTDTNGSMKMMWAGKWCVTEWITVKGNTYYFNHLSNAVTGPNMIKLSVGGASQLGIFDENGVFQNWVTDTGLVEYGGVRYYLDKGIGVYAGLIELDGDYYYINSQFKAVTGPYRVTKTNGLKPAAEYLFGSDGKMIVAKNGLHTDEDGQIRFYKDNVAQYAGLVQDAEGNFYYINSSLKAVRGTAYYVTKTNGLKPVAEYLFGKDGKMIIEEEPDEPEVPDVPEMKQGLVKDDDGQIRYYVDGVAQYAGLVQDAEGNFYYINSSLKAVRGTAYYVTKTNGLKPAAEYLFDRDGKMVLEDQEPEVPEVKQGLVKDDDGYFRYYVDGVAQYAGLVQDTDGSYYYVNSTLKAIRGTAYYVTKTNGLLPAGQYMFAADGKMINPPA